MRLRHESAVAKFATADFASDLKHIILIFRLQRTILKKIKMKVNQLTKNKKQDIDLLLLADEQ